MSHENIIINITNLDKCPMKGRDDPRKNHFEPISQNFRYNFISNVTETNGPIMLTVSGLVTLGTRIIYVLFRFFSI